MRTQQVQRASHDVHHTYRVREPAVLRALIREQREPKLSDPAKALKLRRVDQVDNQPVFRHGLVERNDVMDWIAILSLGHCRPRPKLDYPVEILSWQRSSRRSYLYRSPANPPAKRRACLSRAPG